MTRSSHPPITTRLAATATAPLAPQSRGIVGSSGSAEQSCRGGARQVGKREASGSTSFASRRWLRNFSIAWGSSMQAIIRTHRRRLGRSRCSSRKSVSGVALEAHRRAPFARRRSAAPPNHSTRCTNSLRQTIISLSLVPWVRVQVTDTLGRGWIWTTTPCATNSATSSAATRADLRPPAMRWPAERIRRRSSGIQTRDWNIP